MNDVEAYAEAASLEAYCAVEERRKERELMTDANSRQVGGTHYQAKYQHWDMATDTLMRHLEGAASKYLSRFGLKEGEPASKDLEKAGHYIEKLIEQARTNVNFEPLSVIQKRVGVNPATWVDRFVAELSGPPAEESNVVALHTLASWTTVDQLQAVHAIVSANRHYHTSLEKQAAATKGMD